MYFTYALEERCLFLGHQQHLQRTPFRARFLFHFCDILRVFNDTIKNCRTTIFMDNFTATEKHCHLTTIPAFNEAADMPHLGFIIMVIRLGANLDFLDLHNCLPFSGFLLFLLLLVFELPEIHDTANGRISSRSDFHEIHPGLMGGSNGIVAGHNPQLFPFSTDHPHFTGTDQFIAANPVLGYFTPRSYIRRSYSASLLL